MSRSRTPVGAISIDFTANGCTLVYVGDHASANRFDTCAQAVVAPLAPGERFEAVRALSDGGFAGATDGHIKFYDLTGHVLYDLLAPPGGPIAALFFDTGHSAQWIRVAGTSDVLAIVANSRANSIFSRFHTDILR